MEALLATILLCTVPQYPETRVNAIEVNNYWGGSSWCCQLIFRDGGEIVDWRYTQDRTIAPFVGGVVCCWVEGGRVYCVVARCSFETVTATDNEVAERVRLPDRERKRLR